MQRLLPDNLMIAAVSTRAEVTAQVDDVNLKSGKSKLFVQMKLIGKNRSQAFNYGMLL